MSTALRLGEKLEKLTWAGGTAHILKEEIDRLQQAGSLSIPKEPGGWWHQYVCPHHHAELVFDSMQVDAVQFLCPHGCRIEGEAYRGAWLVFKHQSLARASLQSAAIFAALGDKSYAQIGKRLLVEYAEQFPLYPVHPEAQSWMLKGRAFHQALTEAIWSTTLIRAYLLLRDEGVVFEAKEQAAIDAFLGLLAGSMEEYRHILIHERNNAENNYTAWLNASLSSVYAARGEQAALEELIEGQGGFKHHLSIGVKADQLEFEGSTYYHVFVLRAYLISAEMAQRFGIDLYATTGADGQSMLGMLEALADLADDQGALPALHDGPLARDPYAREIAEIAEQGLAIYGIAGLAPVLREAYRQLGAAGGEQLEALLYGAGESADRAPALEPRGSRLWPDAGFVIGRAAGNPLSFLADFGEHGGSHGHYDKLHLTLMHMDQTLTPDFGMVPYGSPMRKSWFAETASHNTVSLDGRSQAPHEGRCVRYEVNDSTVYAWLQSKEAYEGCTLNRHLLLTGEWLLDWFQVELAGEEPRSIEWWMHPAVQMQSEQLRSRDEVYKLLIEQKDAASAAAAAVSEQDLPIIGQFVASDSFDASAASQLHASYAVGSDPKLHVSNPLGSDPKLQVSNEDPESRTSIAIGSTATVFHTALAQPGDELLAVQTPGNSVDPSRSLTAMLHRRNDRQADFIHVYRAGSRAELTRISAQEIAITVPGQTNSSQHIQLTADKGLLLF
ncbi:heparinase II/III family protein [Paenibacillus frigoriresistens]|uniref:heparinase II/III domain-containing protein n=1 Tax=Paenibacillus alginolyticus TaxID=59839 RepID=UPI0015637D0F|nr:heparinase II/III family protein [Paenibacillus frigoriresistens]NRF90085.1 heparinase II/III family protein [Paenibacillus frigoriresistens]